MSRYLTITATVAVPEDMGPGMARSLSRAVVSEALTDEGFTVVDSGWAADPDTIADALGCDFADHSVVEVLP